MKSNFEFILINLGIFVVRKHIPLLSLKHAEESLPCVLYLIFPQEILTLSSAPEHNAGKKVQMTQRSRRVICLIILKEDLFWRFI